jgi:hypothetical protein
MALPSKGDEDAFLLSGYYQTFKIIVKKRLFLKVNKKKLSWYKNKKASVFAEAFFIN